MTDLGGGVVSFALAAAGDAGVRLARIVGAENFDDDTAGFTNATDLGTRASRTNSFYSGLDEGGHESGTFITRQTGMTGASGLPSRVESTALVRNGRTGIVMKDISTGYAQAGPGEGAEKEGTGALASHALVTRIIDSDDTEISASNSWDAWNRGGEGGRGGKSGAGRGGGTSKRYKKLWGDDGPDSPLVAQRGGGVLKRRDACDVAVLVAGNAAEGCTNSTSSVLTSGLMWMTRLQRFWADLNPDDNETYHSGSTPLRRGDAAETVPRGLLDMVACAASVPEEVHDGSGALYKKGRRTAMRRRRQISELIDEVYGRSEQSEMRLERTMEVFDGREEMLLGALRAFVEANDKERRDGGISAGTAGHANDRGVVFSESVVNYDGHVGGGIFGHDESTRESQSYTQSSQFRNQSSQSHTQSSQSHAQSSQSQTNGTTSTGGTSSRGGRIARRLNKLTGGGGGWTNNGNISTGAQLGGTERIVPVRRSRSPSLSRDMMKTWGSPTGGAMKKEVVKKEASRGRSLFRGKKSKESGRNRSLSHGRGRSLSRGRGRSLSRGRRGANTQHNEEGRGGRGQGGQIAIPRQEGSQPPAAK